MITKQEERNALNKIQKIIESLGYGSYVATAFGKEVFRVAEENIQDDAAYSIDERLKRVQEALARNHELAKDLEAQRQENKKLREMLDGKTEDKAELVAVNTLNKKLFAVIDKLQNFVVLRKTETQKEQAAIMDKLLEPHNSDKEALRFVAELRRHEAEVREAEKLLQETDELVSATA